MIDSLQNLVKKIETLPQVEQNVICDRILTQLEGNLPIQKSGCLDNVINLVDQWLSEDSKYDQEVYVELEDSLAHNSVSIKANLLDE